MLRFKDFMKKELEEDGMNTKEDLLESMTVVVDGEVLKNLSIALESHWQSANFKDWHYRVDPARPEHHQARHIHIARKKHTSAKGMQASWDDQGRRHDNKTFNTKVGDQNAVRDLARTILGLPSSINLEDARSRSIEIAGATYLTSDGTDAWISFSFSNSST